MNLFRLEMASATRIHAPLATVWNVFTDIRRWKSWCKVCDRADVDDSFDWKVGQEIWLKFRMAGVPVPFHVHLDEVKTQLRVAWLSTKFTVTAVRTFTFDEPSPGEVTVTDHKLFTSPVLPLRTFYPRPIIRRMTESMLASLKAESERLAR
jgi:hypothetical protein